MSSGLNKQLSNFEKIIEILLKSILSYEFEN